MTTQDANTLRTITPNAFRFREANQPCTYWFTTGDHIVANGRCRCGKNFVIAEQLPEDGQ